MSSSVRLVTGLFSSQPAALVYAGGRLSLTRGGQLLFDVPATEITELTRPDLLRLRPGLGHLQVTTGGTTYRLAFPVMTGFAGRTSGRQQAARWEQEIRAAQ